MKSFHVVVIGSGPAGQKAAVQAAKADQSVAIIEQDKFLGGACVHRGTIPSKTLRENALRVKKMRENATLCNFEVAEDTEMATLIDRLNAVVQSHDTFMVNQIERNMITRLHGRAHFVDANTLSLESPNGSTELIEAQTFVIASGSVPRHPENIPVDHENILDSDSILSMLYLPPSLIVLGGGVIASEYASIFQALGVKVTMIDRYERPLGFMDEDLVERFMGTFAEMSGKWVGETEVSSVAWNGVSEVVVSCANGKEYRSSKLLVAAGRVANVSGLSLDKAGVVLTNQGHIQVDNELRSSVSNIYAAGDVIGPPSLASASMEQGRRASRNALGISVGKMADLIPAGIYSIPEISGVGLTEQQARAKGDVIVGVAKFEEISRGQISGIEDGLLKIICDAQGKKILGVQIVGEGATELVHIGQMAMLSDSPVDIFVENIFNYPTLAEAYRVAALSVLGQR
ncbi:NAD(P)(+) transhydrogenase [Oleiphilus sp. HI0125]|uniref:Si-specific NAD(P)(+) transhydrogenase n=2 Tax=Oleiphilus sp. HI0125 TaxID=1822266 RepID=UPI0007C212DD|nr:Si-specific NAD(P)(+) transhydrogenase [Oleiphilus sp. HI0125]KZZ57039.1 NAD(P)(+) transhydrogenase [Oleiphilus sp. HI0125]